MADQILKPLDQAILEHQFELLKLELSLINSGIRQMDDITKGVKNWAVVTWTASIGLSIATPKLNKFMWLTALVPFVFWLVDTSFRQIQRTFIYRIRLISEFINSDKFNKSIAQGRIVDFYLLDMRASRQCNEDDYKNSTSWFKAMFFGSVAILYAALMSVSLIIYFIVLH
jgi:hypothetical protein